jgi:hypothetical protein
MKLPVSKIEIKIENNLYEIEFPTTGQLIDIQVLKSDLAGGSYSALINSSSADGQYAGFLVDMIATFTVLLPKLKTDLNVRSIGALPVDKSKKLVKAYLKTYLPWYNEWQKFIINLDEEEESE